MLIFSFCIYGTDLKYYEGLHENLKIISSHPFFTANPHKIYITHSPTAIQQYIDLYITFPNTTLSEMPQTFTDIPRMSRLSVFDSLEDEDYFISRDADSRITPRDIWCISEFIKSNRTLHIIRDHYYHKMRIMAGTYTIKKGPQLSCVTDAILRWKATKTINSANDYGTDEEFLESIIYPILKSDALIHTNSVGYADENTTPITIPQESEADFIGNVYMYVNGTFVPQFTYSKYITPDHIRWLNGQVQYRILSTIGEQFPIRSLSWSDRAPILQIFYMANYYLQDVNRAIAILLKYRHALIDDTIIGASTLLLNQLRKTKRIVASFDPTRQPAADEIVIQYGEYPHNINYLPISSTLYRHPIYFDTVYHDIVEYNPCWEKIAQIYILNLVERKDRYMHLLVDLCRVRAPLHRIHHYKAKKDSYTGDRQTDAYIGATKNHLDVVNDVIEMGYENCLVLEDDVTFISNVPLFWKQMGEYLDRAYAADICFIGYSKHGEIVEHDDLVSKTFQQCTTSSAYLLNNATIRRVQECLHTGFYQMLAGGNTGVYCCDRYWAKLQRDGKMFVMTNKLAYQRITHSDIVNGVNYHFD